MNTFLITLSIIFIASAVYVTFSTIETIVVSKGNRKVAPIIGGIKIAVYTSGLGYVLPKLQESWINLLVYSLGYAFGTFVGMVIIEKMKIGETTIYATLTEDSEQIIEAIINAGFGVSYYFIQGKDSKRIRIEISTSRKREKELTKLLTDFDPNVFIISYEPNYYHGGHF